MSLKDKFVNVGVSLDEIMRGLCEDIDEEDWIEFIKEMDSDFYDDWNMTNNLYDYFKKRHEDFLKDESLTEEEYQEEKEEQNEFDHEFPPVSSMKHRIEINDDVFDTMDVDDCFTA